MSSHKNHKTISFLVPYPSGISPGQRFRFEQYFAILKKNDISYKVFSFFSKPHLSRKHDPFLFFKIGIGFIRRLFHLLLILRSDFVFIFRECSPLGPPVFEWIIAKIIRKKIIYDFDDAIWLSDNPKESNTQKILRCRTKVSTICQWSFRVSCGNEYLQQYALQFNKQAFLNPTTIDTVLLHNPQLHPVNKNKDHITIGWTGSYSTLKYLHQLEHVLQKIQDRYEHVFLLVIADQAPKMELKNLEFVEWSVESEVNTLLKSDIGIMPLPEDTWSKGKCGFKALQYMALEIPAVVSPVGVNAQIVQNEVTGFLASTDDEWIHYLSILIDDVTLRKKLGHAGRKKVEEFYSVKSNVSNFLSLFE